MGRPQQGGVDNGNSTQGILHAGFSMQKPHAFSESFDLSEQQVMDARCILSELILTLQRKRFKNVREEAREIVKKTFQKLGPLVLGLGWDGAPLEVWLAKAAEAILMASRGTTPRGGHVVPTRKRSWKSSICIRGVRCDRIEARGAPKTSVAIEHE